MTDETFDTTPGTALTPEELAAQAPVVEETTVDPTLGTQEPIEDTETVALEEDGGIIPIPEGVEEVVERDGGTSVSAAFRVAAGLDQAGE